MEEILNGGQENHEERRDYANEESKTGYSSEGRKLRPRRRVTPAASSSAEGDYKPYNSHRSYSSDNRGGYGQRGGYRSNSSEHRSYGSDNRGGYGQRGENRGGYGEHSDNRGGYGQRRSYGDNQEGGERRSYGQGRSSYGQSRPSYGRSSYGEGRPSYGQHRSYGDNQEGGERRSYGQGRPSYGQSRPSYGQNRPSYGQRRDSFSASSEEGETRRPSTRPSYGEGRPSYGQRRSFGAGQEGGERRPSYSRKPAGHGFGPKTAGFDKGPKKFHKDEPHFTESDEAGINQMISRKPQLDAAASDNDNVPTPIKEEIRLNKYIANSGVCSRREADNLIQAGVVTVNGEVVTELGTKVNVLKDDIRFNGERLKGEEKVYIVMNKPKGFVTSASDPHAEKTVMDLLKGCKLRVFPVGRLDKSTTGVLMFTNDGEIAETLTHPSYNKKKIYQVILDKELEEEDKEKILTEGLELTDGNIKADELEYIDASDHRRLGIEIHSGKNRIVRRIFESLGYEVKALDRVYFAGLTKKGLKKGEWRYLSEGEVNVLKMGAYV
jgi:23S rRNA pseudouridine2605 synthase